MLFTHPIISCFAVEHALAPSNNPVRFDGGESFNLIMVSIEGQRPVSVT